MKNNKQNKTKPKKESDEAVDYMNVQLAHTSNTAHNKARPSWEEYFSKITVEVATRSTCLRRQTGAVIVRQKRILATGYNGAPSGLKHCSEVGCHREENNIASGERHELCRGLHAEQNAIIQAARHGIDISNSLMFSTHHPCVLCAKMLINAGIKTIYYKKGYPDQLA